VACSFKSPGMLAMNSPGSSRTPSGRTLGRSRWPNERPSRGHGAHNLWGTNSGFRARNGR
jgi:hypothetical protein